VARYENRYFQLERTSDYPPRQAKVTVCEWEDGRIEIRYKGKARPHREIEAPQPQPAAIRLLEKPPKLSHWKPQADHPWRKSALTPAMMRFDWFENTNKGDTAIEGRMGDISKVG
jgi:hypothetical protein